MINKKKYAFYALFIVLFTAFWYLFDFLYHKFITKSPFVFEPGFDFATTVVLAAAIGYMWILREKKQ